MTTKKDNAEEKKIDPSDSEKRVLDIMVEMCDGNPGALTALTNMMKVDWAKSAAATGIMKGHGITGQLIWLCYKDICDKDAQKLIDLTLENMGRTLAKKLEDLPYSDYHISRIALK